MRTSNYLLSTVKEAPADAEIISHQLMLRAGLIRKLGSGLYTWLPLGLKVLKKVEAIVRQEMQNAGAIEILMPSVQPAELWQESGRWEQYGGQLLKIRDRHEREFCYGPTHEEVVTDVMRRELKSYKQLPLNVFQIQTKFRDEIRPRFGVMRAREFIMKDSYSFHLDAASLQQTYDVMYKAYSRIFERLGLHFRAVLADTGSIGGSFSHEFHVLADSGEDLIAYSDNSDYTANVELATCLAPAGERPAATVAMETVDTPTQTAISEVCEFLKVPAETTVKTLLVKGSETPLVALVVRGDHELQELKAEKLPQVAEPFQLADAETIAKHLPCNVGFIGPVGLKDIPVIADRDAAHLANFICGANQNGKHLRNVNWGRDCAEPIVADLRKVVAGDKSPDGKGTLRLTRGIEVGHIFQLGDKYSKALNATVLNEAGRSTFMQMGCYGIGVSRIVGAAIEQNHDANGIIWPEAMAPFDIAITPINMHRSEAVKEAALALYEQLSAAGFDVLLDDRNERPGVMFADMDLIGIPHRVVIGERQLAEHKVEYKQRRNSEAQVISVEELLSLLRKK